MFVNITGRGMIPGVNALAPMQNVDLSERQVRRVLAFGFRVYESKSGLQITNGNVAAIFSKTTKTETANNPVVVSPAVEPVAPVKKKRASKKNEVIEEKIDIVETAVTDTVDISPVSDEEVETFTEPTVTEAVVEEAPVDVVEEVETVAEETPAVEEEVVTEEAPVVVAATSKKNKKKKK